MSRFSAILHMYDSWMRKIDSVEETVNFGKCFRLVSYIVLSCSQTDNIDMVRALIVFGGNVNAINDMKETPRHLAARSRGTNR